MSDKIKRYPDNDRNNDDIRIGHGQQIIPDNVEPLHSRFIPSPYDDEDQGEEKINK